MGGAYKENWLLSQNIAIIINELKHSYYNHAVHVYTCMYIHIYIYIYIYIHNYTCTFTCIYMHVKN